MQSPEVLRIQLENAQTVMSISRMKLLNYLKILRKHVPGNSTDEIHQAMDGIEEVRYFQTNLSLCVRIIIFFLYRISVVFSAEN